MGVLVMLSNKKIICPNNLINVAKKKGTVDAAIVNAGEILPMESVECRYYLLLTTIDQPGVLAKIGTIFKKNGISISAVIQKDTQVSKGTAELVITTHTAIENSIQVAINEFEGIDLIDSIKSIIRIEDN